MHCGTDLDNLSSIPLRQPSVVMKLSRLGAFHPTRLSFTRTLIRRMARENWCFEIGAKNLDLNGFGSITYLVHTPKGSVSFVAFSTPIDDSDRTDRVIAEKWDLTFAMVNGIAGPADIERLADQVPLQEAGRMSEKEIVLSRANKSMRLFNLVADSLSRGKQPNAAIIAQVGYLVRTTAVYGNGKFGCMDFSDVRNSTPFELPFQAEMLTVFLARQLSFDLVEHVAQQRNGSAFVPLSRSLKRGLGVGNATGLGMAPFLIGHPQLIHQWLYLRELAIANVQSVKRVTNEQRQFLRIIGKFEKHLSQWKTDDEVQTQRIDQLQAEIEQVRQVAMEFVKMDYPWRHLSLWSEDNTSYECQELVNSIILEIYPEIVNDLEQTMGVREFAQIDVTMSLNELKRLMKKNYSWALKVNFNNPAAQHIFWYFSQEKEEPRIGKRYEEPGCEKEMRVGIARDVFRLFQKLEHLSESQMELSVAEFLSEFPDFRFIITRIQSLKDFPYAEIQDNLLDANCRPIDLLRCKLSIFGATRFDPKSDLWTRITLFQGAPLFDELQWSNSDEWIFPAIDLNGSY